MITRLLIIPITFFLLLAHARGQSNPKKWNKYYVQQVYAGEKPLYYGFDYPSQQDPILGDILQYPLMVWLSNDNQDTLPIIWQEIFEDNKWVTINIYLTDSEQWETSLDTSLRTNQVNKLIEIFLNRKDVRDSTIICGYNEAAIAALTIKKTNPNIKKSIIFIDDEKLLKYCYDSKEIIYILPKKFIQIANKNNLSICLFVNRISKKEIKKLSKKGLW